MRLVLPKVAFFGVALACVSGSVAAKTPTTIIDLNGGGAVVPANDYNAEFIGFNSYPQHAAKWLYEPYYSTSSTAGINAVFYNQSTCLTGGLSGCSATGNTFTVDYGASDFPLSNANWTTWQTIPTGQAAAGNLLQIPMMGWGVAIPIVNAAVTTSGQLALTDAQLCGIFSGLLTDWSQVSATVTPGKITVDYPTASNSATLYLSNHLAVVCTTGAGGNSNFKPGFTGSLDFTALFSSFPPATGKFRGVNNTKAIADDLTSGKVVGGISFVSQDYSSLYIRSNTLNAAGVPYKLIVAALYNGLKPLLPTVSDINAALNHPNLTYATNIHPPKNTTDAHNPTLWGPTIPVATRGYPIVGYTFFLTPQCYTKEQEFVAVDAFVKAHQINVPGPYLTAQNNNGFSSVANAPTIDFADAIRNHILGDKVDTSGTRWHINWNDAGVCSPLTGRGAPQ